jgi:hypothetical protein
MVDFGVRGYRLSYWRCRRDPDAENRPQSCDLAKCPEFDKLLALALDTSSILSLGGDTTYGRG